MRYDLLHPKALRAALIEHMGPGYGVPTERQVRRWVTGDTPMPGWAKRAVDELMGTTKEAAEPVWVQRLESRLIELRENQDRVAQEAAAGVVTALTPPVREQWAARIEAMLDDTPKQSGEAPAGSPDTEGLGDEVPQGPERG